MSASKNLPEQFIKVLKKCRINRKTIRKNATDTVCMTYISSDWLGSEFHPTDEKRVFITFNFKSNKLKNIASEDISFDTEAILALTEAELTHTLVSCGESTTILFAKDKVTISRTREFQKKSDMPKFEGELEFPTKKLWGIYTAY